MKKLYYVSYDLIKRKDYQTLLDELRRLGAVRVLESVWAMKRTESATTLRDHLAKFIDGDDRLLVIESPMWAGLNLLSDPNKLV